MANEGTSSFEVLLKAEIKVIPTNECKNGEIPDGSFCAIEPYGATDTCQVNHCFSGELFPRLD